MASDVASTTAHARRQRRLFHRPSFLTELDLWILTCFAVWLVVVGIALAIALHVFASHLSVHAGFRQVVVNTDAGWLREIDVLGYRWNGNPNITSDIAFLPIYPLVVSVVHALGLGWNGSAFLVSVLCQGVTLVLLGRLLVGSGASNRQTRWVIGFALLYPAALFAVTGYGTTMLGMLMVGAALAYQRGHRNWAFLVAGLATGVYYTGLAVPLALVVAELRSRGVRSVLSPAGFGRMFLGISGTLGFFVYLGERFGNPFASISVQQAWTGTAPIGSTLERALTSSAIPNSVLGYIGQRQEPALIHMLDAPFLLLLVVATVWLFSGDHRIETWLLAGGAALIVYQSAKVNYAYSVTRLAYPFFLFLPMNVRVRKLMDRVTWTVPYLGCLAISCYWVTLLAQRLYTN